MPMSAGSRAIDSGTYSATPWRTAAWMSRPTKKLRWRKAVVALPAASCGTAWSVRKCSSSTSAGRSSRVSSAATRRRGVAQAVPTKTRSPALTCCMAAVAVVSLPAQRSHQGSAAAAGGGAGGSSGRPAIASRTPPTNLESRPPDAPGSLMSPPRSAPRGGARGGRL